MIRKRKNLKTKSKQASKMFKDLTSKQKQIIKRLNILKHLTKT